MVSLSINGGGSEPSTAVANLVNLVSCVKDFSFPTYKVGKINKSEGVELDV